MEFAQPPPNLIGNTNLAVPPPSVGGGFPQKMDQRSNYINNNRTPFRPFLNLQRPLPGPLGNMTLEDFDGKRLRKSVMRKTVDYNAAIIKALENRIWQRDYRDRRALQPDVMYYPDMMPPPSYPDNPINCVTTRFVKTATNKMRCPIFCMAWTPEGRRLVTGASSGEFTLWNGLTFNFETILQAHDSPVRCMVWSHNDNWMVTGDHAGYVKYWQSNMNNVKMFQAHKEALRGISFSPTDSKFVTCSDDGTLRIWDFLRYQEEKILRGHGADVKCVHWHPQKGLVVSGSKDNQQPIKLWDPKSGQSLATLHAHKSTVMDLKWNENGNWLITASRDHLLKLFDLRNLSQEVQTFRGHKKEASSVAWHPTHEGLFSSGGSDGSIMFWHVGADKEVGAIEQAHDSIVWTLAWHPLGHILCSGSNDHTSKFWTRNRPGDLMRDKYNLNTLPAGIAGLEDIDLTNLATVDEPSIIPGMGPEDKVEFSLLSEETTIPGLDLDSLATSVDDKNKSKKVPYSKPIPRNFQAQWNETTGGMDDSGGTLSEVLSHIVENTSGVIPLQKIAATANGLIMAGKFVSVEPGSKLESAIAQGPKQLYEFIFSGQVPELNEVMDKIREEYDEVVNREYCGDMEFNDDENEDEDEEEEENRKDSAGGRKRPLFSEGFSRFEPKEPRFLPPEDRSESFFDKRREDMRGNNSSFFREEKETNMRMGRNMEMDYRGRDVDMRGHKEDFRPKLDFRPPDDFDDENNYNSNSSGFQSSDDFSESGIRVWQNGPSSFQNRNLNFGGPNCQGFRPPPPPVWEEGGGGQWGGPPQGMNTFGARGGRPPARGTPRMGRGQWGPRPGGPGPRGPPHRGGGGPPNRTHRRF